MMIFFRAFFKSGLLGLGEDEEKKNEKILAGICTTLQEILVFWAVSGRAAENSMFYSGTSDRKKENFLHFFPARGKNAFKVMPVT